MKKYNVRFLDKVKAAYISVAEEDRSSVMEQLEALVFVDEVIVFRKTQLCVYFSPLAEQSDLDQIEPLLRSIVGEGDVAGD